MIAKMLQQIMEERGISQTELARQIGVTRPSINGWLNGSVPSEGNLEALCKFLNVEPSFLKYGISTNVDDDDDVTVNVPAMDRKPTATANETDGNRGVVGMRFSKEWLNSRSQTKVDTIRVFNMTGSSMSPTFEEGDLLIVDTSVNQIISNGIYILRQLGEDVVRRIQFDLDQKTVNVIFDNNQYPNLSTGNSQSLEVVGRVIFAYKRTTNF